MLPLTESAWTRFKTRNRYAVRPRRRMVDRVYKDALPNFRKALEELRQGFASLPSNTTDWNQMRVEPLLRHVVSLEEVLRSKRFAGENARLKRGVPMFHSDLVYLRLNLMVLQETLEREKKAIERR